MEVILNSDILSENIDTNVKDGFSIGRKGERVKIEIARKRKQRKVAEHSRRLGQRMNGDGKERERWRGHFELMSNTSKVRTSNGI